MQYFPQRHTGISISESIEEVLCDFNVDSKTVGKLVSHIKHSYVSTLNTPTTESTSEKAETRICDQME